MDMGRFYDESLGSAAELLLWLSFFSSSQVESTCPGLQSP